jgi:hypothetical protein
MDVQELLQTGRECAASYIILPNSAPNFGEVPAALPVAVPDRTGKSSCERQQPITKDTAS